jgi:dsRNA-specific ribonuclease
MNKEKTYEVGYYMGGFWYEVKVGDKIVATGNRISTKNRAIKAAKKALEKEQNDTSEN